MNNILLQEVKEIKDIGVFYDSLLVFDKHSCEKINKAHMMLVRTHLEYANSVCYPKRKNEC